MPLQKYKSTHVQKYKNTEVQNHASTQENKKTSKKMHKCTNEQLHTYIDTKIHKYTSKQVLHKRTSTAKSQTCQSTRSINQLFNLLTLSNNILACFWKQMQKFMT